MGVCVRRGLLFVVLAAACVATARGAGPGVTYEELTPLAGVVNIQGIWRGLHLPRLPETFCHVGLLGWHCHNTTMHPWNPASLFPKNETPPMPANASCVICPQGWAGPRRSLVDVLVDLPIVQATGRLPTGFYDMHELVAVAKAAQAEVSGAGGAAPSAADVAAAKVMAKVAAAEARKKARRSA